MTATRRITPPKFNDTTGAIRALAMDAVQKAGCGHPGAPMGMAEIAEVLWNHHLRHNPVNPKWADRDRFVFSNGHGSMLIYALLHLTGYDLPIEELKRFRQLHSKTPGIRSTVTPQALKPLPARSVKVSVTRSVLRWRKNCWPTNSIVPVTTSWITTPMFSWATVA